jgi:uncharacterized protein (DUF885 family)
MRFAFALVVALFTALSTAAPAAAASVDTLPIPGHRAWVRIARDILHVRYAIDGSQASQAGLMDDATKAPSFAPQTVAREAAELRADMAAMRKLPWRTWSVDEQIDMRFLYALAQDDVRQLTVEKMYVHRPSAWLESLANNYINMLTYAPKRDDIRAKLTAQIPAMVSEMRSVCTQPTMRDATTAAGVTDALVAMLRMERASAQRDAAIASLSSYGARLKALHPAREYTVIGAQNYAWRLRHVELLPWTPDQLLTLAQSELKRVDADLAVLKPQVKDPKATPQQIALAKALDQQKLLALYDAIEQDHRRVLDRLGIVTVPPGVGPIVARVTPDAMVPLGGDGGSMNPPATYAGPNVGYWNVEHFHAGMPLRDRIDTVVSAQDFNVTSMGPYSVHEGIPGHHLQLSIARLNKDPLRSIVSDPVQNEGWALYAEEEFWRAGGLGRSANAHYNTLRSWRFRVRRVFYDVNVETGRWTLQHAADWQQNAAPGKGTVNDDITRAINWPAQLICYFAGKEQIMKLKADYKAKMGNRYSERAFNDALLALGSVPYVFARAKMLGEPVPGFD